MTARRMTRQYACGIRITDQQMAQLELPRCRTVPLEIRDPTAASNPSRTTSRYGIPRDGRPLHRPGARYRMLIGRTLYHLEMSTNQFHL